MGMEGIEGRRERDRERERKREEKEGWEGGRDTKKRDKQIREMTKLSNFCSYLIIEWYV